MGFNQQTKGRRRLPTDVNWGKVGGYAKVMAGDLFRKGLDQGIEDIKKKGKVQIKQLGTSLMKRSIDTVEGLMSDVLTAGGSLALGSGNFMALGAAEVSKQFFDTVRVYADKYFDDGGAGKGDEGYVVGDLLVVDLGVSRRRMQGLGLEDGGVLAEVEEEFNRDPYRHDYEPAIALGGVDGDGKISVFDLDSKTVREVHNFDVRKLSESETESAMQSSPELKAAVVKVRDVKRLELLTTGVSHKLDTKTNIQRGERVQFEGELYEIEDPHDSHVVISKIGSGLRKKVGWDSLDAAPNLHESKSLGHGESFSSAPQRTSAGTVVWHKSGEDRYEMVVIIRVWGNGDYKVGNPVSGETRTRPGTELRENRTGSWPQRINEFRQLCYDGDLSLIQNFNLDPQADKSVIRSLLIRFDDMENRGSEIGPPLTKHTGISVKYAGSTTHQDEWHNSSISQRYIDQFAENDEMFGSGLRLRGGVMLGDIEDYTAGPPYHYSFSDADPAAQKDSGMGVGLIAACGIGVALYLGSS